MTVGEARALDEAAEMLDAQRLPEETLRDAVAGAGAEAEARPMDPAAEPPAAR